MWQAETSARYTDTTPTSHTETPTHIETRTHDQCGVTTGKSQASDDGFVLQPATRIPPQPATPKLQHTSKQEHTTNVVLHQVGLLFFNYHNDARYSIH